MTTSLRQLPMLVLISAHSMGATGNREKPMNARLMLVADHATARLFRVPGLQKVADELTRLDNPAGHGHERDLGTSAPGRGTGGGEGRRTAYEAEHTLREHATEVFAQHVAREVARLTTAEPNSGLVIVAGPEMLGVLRKHLPTGHGAPAEWPHNLANLPEPDLHRRLQEAVIQLRQ
jgi:protein required for attachment to host cells